MNPPGRMPAVPSAQMASEAVAELRNAAKCRCEDYWTARGLCAPECQSDLLPYIDTLAEYVESLERRLTE